LLEEEHMALTITDFYPEHGKAGTRVTIEGTGFQSGNNSPLTFLHRNDRRLARHDWHGQRPHRRRRATARTFRI
jgi:IPT/TIG domain